MGTSQSSVSVNNQITNIHASEHSSVQTSNSNTSEIQAILQQGLPYLVILLSILLLLQSAFIIHLLRRVRRLKSRLSAAAPLLT